MAIRPSHILSSLLLAWAALGPVHAAELGDVRVLSHIGQPLAAEVELSLVEDAAHPVQARLARPDVYRGANIAMPPVLSGLDIAVTRQGGKQFLRLASIKPVESRHLHVYLELVDGGQRSVRLVTLWLTPDPNPAPAAAVAAPVSAPAAAVAAAATSAAPAALPSGPAPSAQAAPPEPAKAAKPAPVRKPAPPKRRLVAAESKAQAEPHASPEQHAVPAPAACAPAPSAGETNACAVLGAKNDTLRGELGQLEEKVKVLQAAAGVKSAAEAGDAAEADTMPAPEAGATPKAAPRIHRKPKPVAPPEEPLPWLAIGGVLAAVLALAGLVLFIRRRRRAAAEQILEPARAPEVVVIPQGGEDGALPARPSLMALLKARLMGLRIRRRTPQPAGSVDDTPLAQPE